MSFLVITFIMLHLVLIDINFPFLARFVLKNKKLEFRV